ncbi:hypothetical protein LOZ61_002750 [Ophidiomyces ophidiicola]|nr:hypothetical protein LOZ61_002750 [Ophidiomyces ophidiicola]KAI1919635.1 hypothetical protein LOZ64_002142 [Ophidiomyces ophidiicola]KAI1927141.1 hypothetical protein LOZ60_003293 [Ophidiomyces ophidiicola]KAI2002238.1 hypothetical protein LOZ50_005112 [Ophidiomyces ophidiicola]KAI2013607.1 hypothetical protein LOZ49_001945 [Ophidiomyces ophidiicola]
MSASAVYRSLPKYFQTGSRILRTKDVNLFQTFFAADNLVPYIGARYIADFDHPIRPKVVHTYLNRERGILWWSVVDGSLVVRKGVVRSFWARRVRRAFRTALEQRGYDAEGRKLIRDTKGNVVAKEKSLKGTLEIRMGLPLLTSKAEALSTQIMQLVENLERNQKRKSEWDQRGGGAAAHRKDKRRYK